MTAQFTLVLDTAPPANPVLAINEDALRTGADVVGVYLRSASTDMDQMKIWGDVVPTASIQPLEADSVWIPYAEVTTLRLSAGQGRKYVYGRLMDDCGNQTLPVMAWIDYDTTTPVVTISQGVDRGRVSLVTGNDVATFAWQASKNFSEYQVRAVPDEMSPHTSGQPVPDTHGSVGVAGTGLFTANIAYTTQVNAADLREVAPGDGGKILKVFVRTAEGIWSA